jgi:transposase
MDVMEGSRHRVVGGVDTHKDLHVAAVVDEQDRVRGSRCFATTRQGYRHMLAWMRSFGDVERIGIESTGSYGAGLLRFMQGSGIEVLEVTTPDNMTDADVARMTISTHRTPRMLPLPARERSRREAATAWSNP